jgi:hypothetical protein
MNDQDKRMWGIAKIFTYVGGILVAVCAIMIGMLQEEPPAFLFYGAIALAGVGVLIGTYVAVRSTTGSK